MSVFLHGDLGDPDFLNCSYHTIHHNSILLDISEISDGINKFRKANVFCIPVKILKNIKNLRKEIKIVIGHAQIQ